MSKIYDITRWNMRKVTEPKRIKEIMSVGRPENWTNFHSMYLMTQKDVIVIEFQFDKDVVSLLAFQIKTNKKGIGMAKIIFLGLTDEKYEDDLDIVFDYLDELAVIYGVFRIKLHSVTQDSFVDTLICCDYERTGWFVQDGEMYYTWEKLIK